MRAWLAVARRFVLLAGLVVVLGTAAGLLSPVLPALAEPRTPTEIPDPVGDSAMRFAELALDGVAGNLHLRIATDPGTAYDLRCSTNLLDWQSLGCFTNGPEDRSLTISTGGFSSRFFRLLRLAEQPEPPIVTYYAIDNAVPVTLSRRVCLNNTCSGSPTHIMASESPSFDSATWFPYAAAPGFILSEVKGAKTVYLKVKDTLGLESPAVEDSVTLAGDVLKWPEQPSGYYADLVVAGGHAYVAHDSSGLLVIDVADRAAPILRGNYSTGGTAYGVAVLGSYAYLADGNLKVIDVSDPAHPSLAGSCITPWTATQVAMADGFVYLTDGNRLQVVDVSNPENPICLGHCQTAGDCVDVAVAGNYAFVADGVAGLQVIDIRDPDHPVIVGNAASSGMACGVALAGGYAFVADGPAGLLVFDVSVPSKPYGVGVCATAGFAYSVEVAGDHALVANPLGGLQVVDISDPANPNFLREYGTSGEAVSVALAGDYAFVADGLGGLAVVALDLLQTPPVVLRFTIGDDPAATGDRNAVLKSACLGIPTQYMTSESATFSGAVWQSYSSSSPFLLSEANGAKTVYYKIKDAVGESPVVSDTIWLHAGNEMTVAQWPGSPGGYAWGAGVANNGLVLAKGAAGVQVFDVSQPENPVYRGTYNTDGTARGVAMVGDVVLVADGESGLKILDLSNPASPTLIGRCDTPGTACGVAIAGEHAFVADGEAGLQVISLVNPESPVCVASCGTAGYAQGIALTGNYALLADGTNGLQIIDVSTPANPILTGGLATPGTAHGVAMGGAYAFVADGRAGLRIVDVSNPASPLYLGAYSEVYDCHGVSVAGGYAYIADGFGGLQAIDVSIPSDPIRLGGSLGNGYVRGVIAGTSYAFLADGAWGLTVMYADTLPPAVASMAINNGASSSSNRVVTLNNTCRGGPAEYMASESPTFAGASWLPYATAPSFTISSGNGPKTVYFKVRNPAGQSSVSSGTITLAELLVVTSFAVNNGAASTGSGTVTLDNACTGSPVECQASEDPGFADATWLTYSTAPIFTLSTGAGLKTVFFRTRDSYAGSLPVSDTIDAVAPLVTSFAVNNGAAMADSHIVTLDNACTGSPVEYQASEAPGFAGATWLTYSTAPIFTLSTGEGEKAVYFKVRNGFTESATVSDTITAVAPIVTTFAINNGSTMTDSRTVTLNNACTDSPVEYQASTNADFIGATWLTYSTAPIFTLSTREGEKTVYFKVRNGFAESATASDTITAMAPAVTTFAINNDAAVTGSRTVMLNNVCTGSPTEYQASEDAGFAGAAWVDYSTAPYFTLSTVDGVKTVYFKTRNVFSESVALHDTITFAELPIISSFAINAGAAWTTNAVVTLNNICTASPTEYMASTNANFSDATWQAYSTAPSFTLSTVVAFKNVHFKVRNSAGESATANDTILFGLPPTGMVFIPGGTNAGTDPDFGAYSLTVASFYMDRYEVTKAKWDEVYNWAIAHGYSFRFAGSGKVANHPVQTVNWYDTVKWCNARSQKERRPAVYTVGGAIYKTGQSEDVVQTSAAGYRLPTEMEWEYAARGGVANWRFPWGNMIDHSRANYYANGSAYTYDTSPYTTYTYHPTYNDGIYPYTSPAGAFAANGYGLYDMAGNVWEWCFDWYLGPPISTRVLRGSSYSDYADYCRVGVRSFWSPDFAFDSVGFRAVLPPGQQ